MSKASIYSDALNRFQTKPMLTVSTGTTCACLGDERNLREFLVADETAKRLRAVGHTVFLLMIDDSLDPLTYPQLRIAFNKDETLVEQHKHWCGKPISMLPDPWGCHPSYAAHFEQALMDRLHRLECCPTLVSTASLYERGVYAPYVQMTLERSDEIRQFLSERFENYRPDKLFWPLCPDCGYIDETHIETVRSGCAAIYCRRCERSQSFPIGQIQGKLNWKLDCAVRWAIFNVDAEPFTKAYLEPRSGAFAVAQTLSQTFFEGHEVMPLNYGLVKMDKSISYKLLESLPADVLRALMVTNPATDINLTSELVITAASRHKVFASTSYLEAIKQFMPMWLLTPEALTHRERDLLTCGIQFARNFLGTEMQLALPGRAHLDGASAAVRQSLHTLVNKALSLRQETPGSPEDFNTSIREQINAFGEWKRDILHWFRQLIGQEHGLPVPRMLYVLPVNYLSMLEHLLELSLAATPQAATIELVA